MAHPGEKNSREGKGIIAEKYTAQYWACCVKLTEDRASMPFKGRFVVAYHGTWMSLLTLFLSVFSIENLL